MQDELNQILTLLERRGISATRSPKNRFPDERLMKVVISRSVRYRKPKTQTRDLLG